MVILRKIRDFMIEVAGWTLDTGHGPLGYCDRGHVELSIRELGVQVDWTGPGV